MSDDGLGALFTELKNNPQRFLRAKTESENGSLLKLLGVMYRFRNHLFSAGLVYPKLNLPFHILNGLNKNLYRDWLNREYAHLKPDLYSQQGPFSASCRAMMTDLQRDGLNQLAKMETRRGDASEASDHIHRSLLAYLLKTSLEVEAKALKELTALKAKVYAQDLQYLKRKFIRYGIEATLDSMDPKDVQKSHGKFPLEVLAIQLCLMAKPEVFLKAMPSSIRSRYQEEMAQAQSRFDQKSLEPLPQCEVSKRWAELLQEHQPKENIDLSLSCEISSSLSSAVEALFNFKQARDVMDRVQSCEALRQQVQQLNLDEDLENEMLIRILWELQRYNVSNEDLLNTCELVVQWASRKVSADPTAKMELRPILGLPSRSIDVGQVHIMLVFHKILNGSFEEAQKLFLQLNSVYPSLWDEEIKMLLKR